ncbi:CdaR family protein [Deinococcus sp.]|uniref:CdaR family protein n=1 Tax=Deinococcus sp. TaxID=47478 RepID=UPI003CC51A5B
MSGRPLWTRWLSPLYVWRRTVHNLPQKLAALVVAALVWLVATSDRRANIEQGFDVRLEVRDTSTGTSKRAVSNLPATVRVTLQGQRSRLQGLAADKIEASVDTTGAKEGSFNLPVEVRAPDGTQTLRVLPARVQGFVDSQLSRILPVTLSVGLPPADTLPRYGVVPGAVTVSGPSRLVNTVEQVVTAPLVLAPNTQGQTRLVALTAQGQAVTGVILRPSSVTLSRSDTRALPVRTVLVLLPAPPAKLSVVASRVEPPSVRLVGPADILRGVASVTALMPYRAGSYKFTPTFKLPPGIQVLDSVSVTLNVVQKP